MTNIGVEFTVVGDAEFNIDVHHVLIKGKKTVTGLVAKNVL